MSEQTVTLPITGMTCVNCAANIERGFKKLSGIQDVAVNFANEQAKVSFDAAQLGIVDLVASVQRSGYKVPAAHVELPITGMTCANRAANIQRTFNKKVGCSCDSPLRGHPGIYFDYQRISALAHHLLYIIFKE